MAKKYYWLKLHRDFFKRHDVRIIEAMPNGKDYVLFLLKLMAESIDHEGRLRFNNAIPYNDAMLATITNTNIDVVRTAVKIFQELGLMTILDDETLYMGIVEDMIGSRSDSADRVARHRARRKALDALHVTDSNVTSISSSISSSEEEEKTKKAKHPTLHVPMNQTRYETLCSEYGQSAVDNAIQERIDWEAAKGKPKAKDYAAAAANWLRRAAADGRVRKPTKASTTIQDFSKLESDFK